MRAVAIGLIAEAIARIAGINKFDSYTIGCGAMVVTVIIIGVYYWLQDLKKAQQ